MNQGDDVAGTVHELGSNTYGFSVGDRIAALHCPGALFGTYAEFCIVEAWTVWYVLDTMSMAEAATIPLAAVTAGVALWGELSAPWPWAAGPREPIVIYGASSAVGAFGVKLAKMSGLSLVIAIAGGGRGYVEKLNGEEATVEAIKAALNGQSVKLGLDAISTASSERILGRVLNPASGTAKIAIVLPINPAGDIEGIVRSFTMSTLVFSDAKQSNIGTNTNRWLGATIVKLIEMAAKDGLIERSPIRDG